MDKEHIVNFLRSDSQNAYSYEEIAKALGKRMEKKIPVKSVKNAVRELMHEQPRRIVRHTSKQPHRTVSGRTVMQTAAFFAIKVDKKKKRG